ncbi:methyltransferase domain-containing protein [Litorihabitans aurantiacus]|uniref:Methyltransferase domain-containing protein n=1 Tax=Litorihabitans aurantiacus TaxID=1930061 RepID=A0AA37XHW4_9MICO|nr:class I SAM-dependent methyltransferase [Litorihabitans aurantiacus]GMA32915.1 hypothetical protein GCM10025875_29070 [Litorihabitans aurantiacus]
MVERPVEADWLALRRSADHRARERARDLLALLREHLREVGADEAAAWDVVDLGAGTGSNLAWLAPRLPGRQRWSLVDHDADLAAVADTGEAAPGVEARWVLAGADCLTDLLADLEPEGPATLVTCAALLDLLRPDDVGHLLDALAPVGRPGIPALLSLSVTGEVELHPSDPDDAFVAATFDAHQRRGGLLGPGAADVVAAALRARGARVHLRSTDWVLGTGGATDADDAALVRRYVRDRADVVAEQDPSSADRAQAWWRRREQQLERGELRVRVGHVDLLSLPPRDRRVP